MSDIFHQIEKCMDDAKGAFGLTHRGHNAVAFADKRRGWYSRRLRARGMQEICEGNNKMKNIQSRAGRLKKKYKKFKKNTEVVTLTEIYGIPWRVTVTKPKR